MLDQLKHTVKQQIAEGRETEAIQSLLAGLRDDSVHCKGLLL